MPEYPFKRAANRSHPLSGMISRVLVHQKANEMHDRDTFLAVLMAIHLAGVHHGDLRYENLLINDSGKVTIIDLDRATLNASESAREEEYRKLCSLLETKVDDSVPEDVKQGGRNRTRIRKEQDSIGVQNTGRVTRSMGTARQTSGGMTLRPRR